MGVSDREIRERVSRAISESDLSLLKIAKIVGTSHVTVSKWKRGEAFKISAANLYLLSKALHRSLEWLISGKGTAHIPVSAVPAAPPEDFLFTLDVPLNEDGTFSYSFMLSQTAVPFTVSDEFFRERDLRRENCVWYKVEETVGDKAEKGDLILFEKNPDGFRDGDICLIVSRVCGTVKLGELYHRLDGGVILRKPANRYADEEIGKEDMGNIYLAGRAVLRCHAGSPSGS